MERRRTVGYHRLSVGAEIDDMTKSNFSALSSALLEAPPPRVSCPAYDRAALTTGILHIGVGGFHRSHQAAYLDDLASHGISSWGLCGIGIMPQDESMHEALVYQDCLYTLVERDEMSTKARIIGSIKTYLPAWRQPEAALQMMAKPSIKLVTITATEGGYFADQKGETLDFDHPAVKSDLTGGHRPQTIYGYLSEALDRRMQSGLPPFSVLSCDNIQNNGGVTRRMLLAFLSLKNPELMRWVERNVAFPSCMVDRITPATTDAERELVRTDFGIDDRYPVVSESFRQWVVEDEFSNGRPPLELVGVQFTHDVASYERMKLRMLNASHSAMGYLGYLCGYRYIHDVARSQEFRSYVSAMIDEEVIPNIGGVPGIDLNEYKDSILDRFSNKFIKDQVLRICMDGSAKMPKFVVPSIVDQVRRGQSFRRLALCVASWIRFLSGRDESGNPIPIVDPQGDRLQSLARAAGTDPRVFVLNCRDIFGELADSEVFVTEVETILSRLYSRGASDMLAWCRDKAGTQA